MERYYQQLSDWELSSSYPYVPLMGANVETGVTLRSITPTIPAKVPGSVYRDLLNAGLIEDPFYEMNSLKCEWVANRWWVYQTKLQPPHEQPKGRIHLVLEGVDYRARVYLNDELLGIHEGMNIPVEYDVTNKLQYGQENRLCVMLENAPEEMAQIGYTSQTKLMKSRYDYKWDFCTRLVHLGLYKKVYLKETGSCRFTETQVTARAEKDSKAFFRLRAAVDSVRAQQAQLQISIPKAGVQAAVPVTLQPGRNLVEYACHLSDIHYWNTADLGTPTLYDLTAQVVADGQVCDEWTGKAGFKHLEIRPNERAAEDALPYTFVLNGRPLYIKGVNMTPLDELSHAVDRQWYADFLALLRNAHVNLIRVWGGGLIESEDFYELCDEYGIMVWQEFPQSSSGIDNIPSQDPGFLRQLRRAAVAAVLRIRNHVSLAAYSGGNELTDADYVPSTMEDPNIAMLREVVETLDPGRYMYPTSGSGPHLFLTVGDTGRNHDVHGEWKYVGTQEHYRRFNESDSLLHSEFGVDGVNNLPALKTILAPENQGPFSPVENLTWRHHGETWDTLGRDEAIFGKFASLRDFVIASQFIQGEGLRYAVEANRRRAYQNSGSIIWQSNEPWVNTSCTNLIDYYRNPKLAYYMVAQAYAPVHASLRYDKLVWQPGETIQLGLYVSSDLPQGPVQVELRLLSDNGECVLNRRYETQAGDGYAVKLDDIQAAMGRQSITIELTASAAGNCYTTSVLLLAEHDGICSLQAVKDYLRTYYPQAAHCFAES